jgi:hypothetical protein
MFHGGIIGELNNEWVLISNPGWIIFHIFMIKFNEEGIK